MLSHYKTYNFKLPWFAQKLKSFLLAMIVIMALNPNSSLNASEYNETQIKVAFIFKMMDFIDGFPGSKEKQTLCLYGFNKEELQIINSDIDSSKYTNIEIVSKNSVSASRDCKIIFFRNNYTDYKNVLDYIENSSILTFAEIKYFSDNGGMVEFYKKKGKYKFIINNELAIKEKIFFNAKLLEISK